MCLQLNQTYASSATKIYTPHVFRRTRQVAMRATTSGTSTRKPGFLFDADLHGPHNNGNVMIPVVGEAACATGPSACAVSGGYGDMVVREMGRREEEEKKRNGGRGPFIPQTNGAFLKCDTLHRTFLNHKCHMSGPEICCYLLCVSISCLS